MNMGLVFSTNIPIYESYIAAAHHSEIDQGGAPRNQTEGRTNILRTLARTGSSTVYHNIQ